MIIIRVMGGLGNQLQQYALCEKLRFMGREAKLDLNWYEEASQQEQVLARRGLELGRFDRLVLPVCTKEEREALLGRGGLAARVLGKLRPASKKHFYENAIYHPEIFSMEDCYLEGYWACEKYYHDILPRLRDSLVFPASTDPRNAATAERMRQEESVSLHVRRGDYLDPANAEMFGGICTGAYYRSAEELVRGRLSQPHFYVFSDDPEFAHAHYSGQEYTVVDWNKGADSLQDIRLMSCCKHNICANSTFSFWGARLNPAADHEALRIRPARHKISQPIEPDNLHLWWEGWELIDEQGRRI